MVCDALAAARAIEKLADCGPLSHEIATARSSGAQEHQISLFFEVPSNQSCSSEGETTAGEFPKPIMWPIVRSTPDVRPGQPQTKKRKCGSQPAHQSLFTDVFRSRPLLCTIYLVIELHAGTRGEEIIACVVLDLGHQNGMVRPRSPSSLLRGD